MENLFIPVPYKLIKKVTKEKFNNNVPSSTPSENKLSKNNKYYDIVSYILFFLAIAIAVFRIYKAQSLGKQESGLYSALVILAAIFCSNLYLVYGSIMILLKKY